MTMDDLERAFRHLRSLRFPTVPDDEGLAGVIERLSELDTELARLAARAGKGGVVRRDEVPVIRGLVNRLSEIERLPEQDAEIYTAAVEYLEALASLRDVLLQEG